MENVPVVGERGENVKEVLDCNGDSIGIFGCIVVGIQLLITSGHVSIISSNFVGSVIELSSGAVGQFSVTCDVICVTESSSCTTSSLLVNDA